VEYGNLLDISRENGETIFTASIVYDWCHNLLTAEDKELFYKELMRLALIMECGYPPFKQQITTGHGSEAMMNRDMLSMAVAFYEKNPKILQYLSYQIFERLIPLRDFEYRSPRHSQGIMYATFRFRWEMYNAFIFKRMLDREVFGDGMRKMGYMWMHMRTPGGEYFRSGDGVWWDYKSIPSVIMLMCSSYAGDDVLKAAYRTTDYTKIDPFEYILFSNTAIIKTLRIGLGKAIGHGCGGQVGVEHNDFIIGSAKLDKRLAIGYTGCFLFTHLLSPPVHSAPGRTAQHWEPCRASRSGSP
jgi:heparin/heparan-sulfate lyase